MAGERPVHCKEHKQSDEVNMRHTLGSHPGCNRRPSFAQEGSKATHCGKHEQAGEVSISVNRK